jgi:glycosyltransferase involved in cell wall biosynthesis
MRCVILAHGLRAGGGVVVGHNLIANIIGLSSDDEWLCIVPRGIGYEREIAERENCKIISLAFRNALHRMWFDHTRLIGMIDDFRPDILLVLGNIGLTGKRHAQAVFLHQSQLVYDSIHYGRVGLKEKLRYAYLKWRFKRQLVSTKVIFCQTPVMKKRIVEKYDYQGAIEVVGTAVDMSFGQGGRAIENQQNDDVFRLLYLTRYYTHKNIEILVDVFDKYRKQLADVQLFLTIDSAQHKHAEEILSRIKNNSLSDNIINIGPVEKSAIAQTYASVDAVIIPTLLESFGITYIEAMLSAKPILTADLDFAHEQCGNAALYFNPWDATDVMNAIVKLKDNSMLQAGLVEEGKKRLDTRAYNWGEISQQMHRSMVQLTDGRGPK